MKNLSLSRNTLLLILTIFLIGSSSCNKKAPASENVKTEKAATPIPTTSEPAKKNPIVKKEKPKPEPKAEVKTPPTTKIEIKEPKEEPKNVVKTFKGSATYYHDKFQGRKTASGDVYDRNLYTAAIRTNAVSLPLGTIVEVTNIKRNKKVRVKVNDKMNNKARAIIDLSFKAAHEIGLIMDGRTKVNFHVVEGVEAGPVE